MFLEWRVLDSPKIHVLKAPEKFTDDGKLKPEVRTPIWLLISRRNIYGIISGLC
jgi:hypothetical protein